MDTRKRTMYTFLRKTNSQNAFYSSQKKVFPNRINNRVYHQKSILYVSYLLNDKIIKQRSKQK